MKVLRLTIAGLILMTMAGCWPLPDPDPTPTAEPLRHYPDGPGNCLPLDGQTACY